MNLARIARICPTVALMYENASFVVPATSARLIATITHSDGDRYDVWYIDIPEGEIWVGARTYMLSGDSYERLCDDPIEWTHERFAMETPGVS